MIEEEFITKAILTFLKAKKYNIISFDFPQSGTGILLHSDVSRDKNKGIKPDVIASKGELMIVMENKNKYWREDFEKLHKLKIGADYTSDLKKLQSKCNTAFLKVGVGIPNSKNVVKKALETAYLIDFIISVDEEGKCEVIFGKID